MEPAAVFTAHVEHQTRRRRATALSYPEGSLAQANLLAFADAWDEGYAMARRFFERAHRP